MLYGSRASDTNDRNTLIQILDVLGKDELYILKLLSEDVELGVTITELAEPTTDKGVHRERVCPPSKHKLSNNNNQLQTKTHHYSKPRQDFTNKSQTPAQYDHHYSLQQHY